MAETAPSPEFASGPGGDAPLNLWLDAAAQAALLPVAEPARRKRMESSAI
jgi:hypothetical protein